MSHQAAFELTIPFETPAGGLVEIDLVLHANWYPAEGDNWNSPQIEAGYEIDYAEPKQVTIYHPDDEWTTLTPQKGSILWHWLDAFLERNWDRVEREQALLLEILP